MHYYLFVLAAACAVRASTLPTRQNVPACAQTCFNSAATADSSCGSNTSNYACLCADGTFLTTVASCVTSSCSADDTASALTAAEGICSSAGVSIDPATIAITGAPAPTGTTTAPQPTSTTPACALTCFSNAAIADSDCKGNSSDYSCLCADSSFLTTVGSCVESSCSASDTAAALASAEGICASAGVPIDPATISLTSGPSATQSGSASAPTPSTPTCALTCFNNAATADTNCGGNTSNYACLCADSSFLTTVGSCVETSCSASDTAAALNSAESLCAGAGVTINPATIALTGSATVVASSASAAASNTAVSKSSASASSASPSPTKSSAAGYIKVPSTFAGLLALVFAVGL